MNTCIVYYSLTDNSHLVAEKLSALLRATVIALACEHPYPATGARRFIVGGRAAMAGDTPALLPYSFDDDAYDLVVLCAPVWANKTVPAMNTFLRDHPLTGCRVALALTSTGGSAEKAAADYRTKLGQDVVGVLSLRDPARGKEPELDERIAHFAHQLEADSR